MTPRDAHNIRARRTACGLNAEQLGKLAGVSRQTVQNIEAARNISPVNEARILLALRTVEDAAGIATAKSSASASQSPIERRVADLEDQVEALARRVDGLSRLELVLATLDDAEGRTLAALGGEPLVVRQPTGAATPDRPASAQHRPNRRRN